VSQLLAAGNVSLTPAASGIFGAPAVFLAVLRFLAAGVVKCPTLLATGDDTETERFAAERLLAVCVGSGDAPVFASGAATVQLADPRLCAVRVEGSNTLVVSGSAVATEPAGP